MTEGIGLLPLLFMKKFIFILMFLLVGRFDAWACSCMELDPIYSLSIADQVFIGKARSVKNLDKIKSLVDKGHESRVQVEFDISEVFRSSEAWSGTLHTVQNKWSCDGYGFGVGEEYIIFAHQYDDEESRERFGKSGLFGTSLCGGTRFLSHVNADTLDRLGKFVQKAEGKNVMVFVDKVGNSLADVNVCLMPRVILMKARPGVENSNKQYQKIFKTDQDGTVFLEDSDLDQLFENFPIPQNNIIDGKIDGFIGFTITRNNKGYWVKWPNHEGNYIPGASGVLNSGSVLGIRQYKEKQHQ